MNELVSSTVDRITATGFDPRSAPWPHRVAVLVTTAQGLIDNGGFEYFFERPFGDSPNTEDFEAAYRAIGAAASADAMKKAMARASDASPSFEDLNKVFWGESEKVFALLESYIRANRDAYV